MRILIPCVDHCITFMQLTERPLLQVSLSHAFEVSKPPGFKSSYAAVTRYTRGWFICMWLVYLAFVAWRRNAFACNIECAKSSVQYLALL